MLFCPLSFVRHDCGFFCILYIEHFNGKVMMEFGNNAIPNLRKVIAASLIDNRDNGDISLENVMEEELVKKK
jgi:Ulp1 family protease